MKTHSLLLTLITGLLILSSCDQEQLVDVSPDQAITTRAAGNRPFSGSYTTSMTILAPPPMLQWEIVGEGQATHLGQSTFVAYSTVDMTTDPPFLLSGTAVHYAANGDELFSTFSGTVTPNGEGANDVVINHIITGGTGRFVDAEGAFSIYTVAVPGVLEGESHSEGFISYFGWACERFPRKEEGENHSEGFISY